MNYGDMRLPARFWAKISIDNNGCWVWTAASNGAGYGRWNQSGSLRYPHRVTAELEYGESTLQVDHVCRVRACCNPDHLEYVTNRENSIRGKALITHCPKGHEYSEDNTLMRNDTHRHCRACKREWDIIGYHNRKDINSA